MTFGRFIRSALSLLNLLAVASVGLSGFAELYFKIEPSDIVVTKDGPAMLDCVAVGEPMPSIEWKREGTTLQFIGETRRSILPNGSLYFSSVYHTRTERPDEGVYQCVASIKNVGTIVSRLAKVQVTSLPRFDEQPQDMTVFPGQSAYFPCSIQSVPPATISWLKDEQPFQLDHSRMIFLPSGALEIDHIQSTDSGAYRCNTSNTEKHRLSSVGTLTVSLVYAEANRLSAPQFIAIPRNTIATEGTNVTLDCAANGNPRTRIVWLKDGVTIDMADLDSKFSIAGIGSLQIEDVKESDRGTYMCRAENHEDSVDASATLEVQVPPRFIKSPHNKYAYEKEDIEFECEIYGFPEPTVQWFKNGDLIIQSEYFQLVNGYNLRILGLVRSDMGIYQCIGSNPAGSTQSSAQLIILDPGDQPHAKDVPSAPREVTAVIVSTRFVTLSWKEPLHPNGDISAYSVYYREDTSTRERVVNTSRPRLEEVSIQGLQPSTQFYFRIVAYSQHGPGQSSAELVVETQPEVHVPGSPENLHAVGISPSSIYITWHSPDQRNGPIQKYKLHYFETGTTEEHEITTSDTTYTLYGLKKYTEYTFWIVAYNQNGPGPNSEEVIARTFSDLPSDMPQNVTLEAASSTSIIVRWEPPPKDNQNGIITGYKLRYKLKGSKRGDIVTTDGNRRLYALTGLERGAQYSVKIAALSINGSGPATEWMTMETYQNDLDETRVPDQPSSLRAKPTANTIYVSWTPPRNQNIMIRGYTIGWGIGFPDVYTKVLEGKQRYHTIENLYPSVEYVISLRAFNQVGDGQPIYETVKTLIESTPEPLTPMLPPVGLKAIVLSPTTVVLYWTDTTLPRNQLITDNRYYVVRYAAYSHSSSSRKYRYFNSTDLNCMIDDLKPNSQYEFVVKVVKGRRESKWSMSVLNSTHEGAPSSPPRDLTLTEDQSVITAHWQSPKQSNGQITGYVIFYTTDNTQRDRDWVVENINENKLTTTLKGLSSDTRYYFKIQARNNKGYGPFSTEVIYHTKPANEGLASYMLYIIIASVTGFTLIVIIAVILIFCKCKQDNLGSLQKTRYGTNKGVNKGKGIGKELKPPDLWIHHDQMELKSIQKGNVEAALTVTPIPRNSQELADDDLSILDKKSGTYVAISSTAVLPNNIGQHYEGTGNLPRPLYPRTQYNIPRAHVAVDASLPDSPDLPSPSHNQQPPLPYEQAISQSTPAPHIALCASMTMGTGQHPSYTGVSPGTISGASTLGRGDTSASSTLGKRSHAHPLKSFSVPAPPCQSAPTTPQPKHVVRTQPSSSPHKGFNTPCSTPAGPSSQQSTLKSRSGMPTVTAQPSYSTEELNQEMANLEGLMKDLNAITASEFEC